MCRRQSDRASYSTCFLCASGPSCPSCLSCLEIVTWRSLFARRVHLSILTRPTGEERCRERERERDSHTRELPATYVLRSKINTNSRCCLLKNIFHTANTTSIISTSLTFQSKQPDRCPGLSRDGHPWRAPPGRSGSTRRRQKPVSFWPRNPHPAGLCYAAPAQLSSPSSISIRGSPPVHVMT